MTKTCTKCGETKPKTEFSFKNKSANVLASNCKTCQKVMKDKHYQKNKDGYKKKAKAHDAKQIQRWQAFKATLSCEECGESRTPTLDFHHTEDNKDRNVPKLVSEGCGWPRIMAEVSKCIVLCSNCHRVLHDKLKK